MFNNALNAVLGPVLGLNPAVAIFLIGSVISIVLTLVNKKIMGTEEAKNMKKNMMKMRTDLLEAQKAKDEERVKELSAKMMKVNSEYLSKNMKLMMKPLLISMVLAISVLPWLQENYAGMVVATVPEIIPFVGGSGLSWIWWYILSTLAINITLRKILGE